MSQETKQSEFIRYLESHRENRAMLAELRRGMGKSPGETPSMFPYVVPFIHNTYDETVIYIIAPLFGLHPSSTAKGNLGNHLLAYANEVGDSTATTRRFVQLMRMRLESLEPRLRQQISLLKSKDILVNWHQLYYDLRFWDHDDRFVQKKWAEAYWSPSDSIK